MAETAWEKWRKEIEQLYIVERYPLSKVIAHMEDAHSWSKSGAQYARQLKKWGFKKNQGQIDYRWIVRRVSKRKREAKESQVFVHGAHISSKMIQKWKYREGFVPTDMYNAPSPRTPEGYTIHTPPNFEMNNYWNNSLPWLKLMKMIVETNKDTPRYLFFTSLLPMHQNVIPNDARIMLVQYLRSTIPCSRLQSGKSLSSPSGISAHLNILMPEEYQGQHEELSENMVIPPFNSKGYLTITLFFLSNNLFSSHDQQRSESRVQYDDNQILNVVDHFGLLNAKHLKDLLSISQPTAESIAEKLFGSALRSCSIETLRIMLEAGMNPDLLIEISGLDFLTPLQFVANRNIEKDIDLLKLLVVHGANVDFSMNNSGETALCFAIRSHFGSAMRMLLTRGATVTSYCAFEATFAISSTKENFGVLQKIIDTFLARNLVTESDLMEIRWPTVKKRKERIIQFFCPDGLKLGSLRPVEKSQKKTTLLGIAVLSQDYRLVRQMIDSGMGTQTAHKISSYASPLSLAAHYGLTEISEALIKSGADVAAADQEELTLLERAVRTGNSALCALLINNGAKVDRAYCEIQESHSALMIAVQQGYLQIMELLIESGARLNDKFKTPPGSILAAAIEIGDQVLIKRLLVAGSRFIGVAMQRIGNLQIAMILRQNGVLGSIIPFCGPTILAAAISSHQYDLAYFILRDTAYMRSTLIQMYDAPLEAAVKGGSIAFTKILSGKGALITDRILAEAVKSEAVKSLSDHETLSYLLKSFTGKAPTAIAIAVLENSSVMLNLLREANVDPTGPPQLRQDEQINQGSVDPTSVLEMAATPERNAHFKFILEWTSTAKITWCPKAVGRALTVAILSEAHEDHIRHLVQLECDFTQDVTIRPNSFGLGGHRGEIYNPLQAAVKKQSVHLVVMLLKKCDVNYLGEGRCRRTPLQIAVEQADIDIVNILLSHGADINSPASYEGGATALQIAALQGYIGIAKHLIDRGADPNLGGAKEDGRTALQGAAEYGRIDMLQILYDAGAMVDGDYEDRFLEAVRLAESHGHLAAAKLLRSFPLPHQEIPRKEL